MTDPLLGRTFGDFRIDELVGRGAMGRVYAATQSSLKRRVAIKLLDEGPFTPDEFKARFRRETQAVARLRHPNIVAVHEAGEIEGRPYFSMDLVDGRSLAAILEKGPLATRRAMEIVRDVAAAIAHAHAEGVVHRDLKPGNVLVDAADRVYVADFGLAKTIDLDGSKLTQSGRIMGTPAYMAPEQARGSTGLVDPRTDVYGMGAVLYHMLTGAAPFGGADIYHVLSDVVGTDPATPRRRNDKVHVDAETICLKAMEKDPARRYASAADFRADVERFLEGEPIEAQPPGLWSRWTRRARRRPAVALLLLAIAAGAVFAAGLLMSRDVRHRRRLEAQEFLRDASTRFLAGDLPAVEACAGRAIEADPSWAPGWFWKARVVLSRYAQTRGVAAVWESYGELEFEPLSPETESEAALRAEALDALRRAGEGEGLQGWESDFVRSHLAFYAGRYAEASFEVARREGTPDREIDLAAGYAAYYGRDFPRALELALAARRRWGNDAVARALEVNALLACGLTAALTGNDPVEKFYSPALEAADDPVLRARALTFLGTWHAEHGGDAEAAFRQAQAAVEGIDLADARVALGDALLGLADVFAQTGREDPDDPLTYTKAVEAYTRAVELAPGAAGPRIKRAFAFYHRLEYCFELGRTRESVETLAPVVADLEAIVRTGELLDAALLLADLHAMVRSAGDKDVVLNARRRVEEVQSAVAAHRPKPRGFVAEARALINQGIQESTQGQNPEVAHRRAVDACAEAIEMNPRYAAVYLTRALVRSNLHGHLTFRVRGRLDAARAALDLALADYAKVSDDLNPLSLEGLVGAAKVLLAESAARSLRRDPQGDIPGRARAWLDRAAKVNPRCLDVYYGLAELEALEAEAQFEHGGGQEALQRASDLLMKALEINPRDQDSVVQMSRLHHAAFHLSGRKDFKSLEKAMECADLGVQIGRNRAIALRWRASLLVKSSEVSTRPDEDLDAALADYRTILAIDPSDLQARRDLADAAQERAKLIDDPTARLGLLRECVDELWIVQRATPERHLALVLGQFGLLVGNLQKSLGVDPKPDLERALEAFGAAEAESPLEIPREVERIQILFLLGRAEEADRRLDALPPDHIDVIRLRESRLKRATDF